MSHFINVYGLRTESDGPRAFDDFVRQEGIPTAIRSDNSKIKRWEEKLIKRLQEWVTASEFTEPYHPQQNPAELRAIRWLKNSTRVIRQRTGEPKEVWLWIAKYLAYIHNITADETLGWKTPW